MSKMAFFEPKNRGIQKNISAIAHICWQTPFGTTGGPREAKTANFGQFFGDFGHFQDFSQVKVPVWPFWPFWPVEVNLFHGLRLNSEKKNLAAYLTPGWWGIGIF